MNPKMAVNKKGWTTTSVVNYGAMALAALILMFAIGPSGDKLASDGAIQVLVGAIGSLVPAVDVIAIQTTHPEIARLAVASQWLFFPVYLGCMIINQPPWKPLHWKEGISAGVRRKAFICAVVLFLVLSIYAYGDLRHGWASILGGTLFSPDVPLWWLRLPFAGRFGLAVSAFLMPLLESVIYWLLLALAGTTIAWAFGLGRRQANRRSPE